MRSTILSVLLLFSASSLFGQHQVKLKVNEELTTDSGLKIKLLEGGKGKQLTKGDKVKVHYTGTLVDGRQFDSSRERNQPFEFVIGMKQVIAGWDEALTYLKVGDHATLTVPPELGYGETPMPKIPVGSYLVFDIEVCPTKLTHAESHTKLLSKIETDIKKEAPEYRCVITIDLAL